MTTKYLSIALLLLGMLTSCDDFLDITPTGKVIATTADEYRALLTYEYKNFPEDRGLATLRSDEMLLDKAATNAEDYDSFFDIWAWNDDAPSATTVSFGWRRYYHAIYVANYILAHQHTITQGTPQTVAQLVGEAYAMRAYAHFLLANLYAEPYTHVVPSTTRGIPLQLVADINHQPKPASLEAVYTQVLTDLEAAKGLLNVKQWDKGFNYRFSTVAVDALQARAYLTMGRWEEALAAAQRVLTVRPALENMNQASATLPNHYASAENILALEQVMTTAYKNIGRPAKELIALYRSGDLRKSKYFRQETATKSSLRKGGSNEYACSFRTAEAYLIAAEAAARLGDAATALTYLNTLVDHRYNATTATAYKAELAQLAPPKLVEEILNERTRELAFEGFRWFDLRRTHRPALQKSYNDATYQLSPNDVRYTLRFPTEAVEANPALSIWK